MNNYNYMIKEALGRTAGSMEAVQKVMNRLKNRESLVQDLILKPLAKAQIKAPGTNVPDIENAIKGISSNFSKLDGSDQRFLSGLLNKHLGNTTDLFAKPNSSDMGLLEQFMSFINKDFANQKQMEAVQGRLGDVMENIRADISSRASRDKEIANKLERRFRAAQIDARFEANKAQKALSDQYAAKLEADKNYNIGMENLNKEIEKKRLELELQNLNQQTGLMNRAMNFVENNPYPAMIGAASLPLSAALMMSSGGAKEGSLKLNNASSPLVNHLTSKIACWKTLRQ